MFLLVVCNADMATRMAHMAARHGSAAPYNAAPSFPPPDEGKQSTTPPVTVAVGDVDDDTDNASLEFWFNGEEGAVPVSTEQVLAANADGNGNKDDPVDGAAPKKMRLQRPAKEVMDESFLDRLEKSPFSPSPQEIKAERSAYEQILASAERFDQMMRDTEAAEAEHDRAQVRKKRARIEPFD